MKSPFVSSSDCKRSLRVSTRVTNFAEEIYSCVLFFLIFVREGLYGGYHKHPSSDIRYTVMARNLINKNMPIISVYRDESRFSIQMYSNLYTGVIYLIIIKLNLMKRINELKIDCSNHIYGNHLKKYKMMCH